MFSLGKEIGDKLFSYIAKYRENMGGLKQCFYEGYFLSSICICKV